MNILHLLPLLSSVAAWATLYSFEEGLIYLHLKNNDLVALNFSVTGLDRLSKYSLDDVNYHNGQHVQALAAPPTNSSLFVWNSGLYAFSSSVEESLADYNRCGNGVFQLSRYNSSTDEWTNDSDSMTFSQIDDISYYADATYLTSPDSSTIYIYGGRCGETISGRLLSYDMQEHKFANISTSTTPQAFYGAGSVWAATPQQTLVIGGRSAEGWLNMGQIASWGFSTGWSSVQVANSSGVASRTGALVLPAFQPLSSASKSSLLKEYDVSDILVVGGEASGGPAEWARLRYSANEWKWTSYSGTDDVLGAAVIFNTLVVVNDTPKRDGSYQLGLLSVQDLASVTDLSSNLKDVRSSDSKKVRVIVGTLVPLAALLVAIGGFFLWKRRRQTHDSHSIAEPLEYQFGHYRTDSDGSSLLREKPLGFSHVNDSASTLDVRSMDSWVRKRQEYEANLEPASPGPNLVISNSRILQRSSYLASNETLLSDEKEERARMDLGSARLQSDIDQDNVPANIANDYFHHPAEDDTCDPFNASEARDRADVPLRVAQLKKTFSYSHTPPTSPIIRKKSRLDPGFYDVTEQSENDSIDENMDVQVLVSSRRKAVLRIANPDTPSRDNSLRQRAPS